MSLFVLWVATCVEAEPAIAGYRVLMAGGQVNGHNAMNLTVHRIFTATCLHAVAFNAHSHAALVREMLRDPVVAANVNATLTASSTKVALVGSLAKGLSRVGIRTRTGNALLRNLGSTALHLCAALDNFDMIQVLLEYGASTDRRNKLGQDPLQAMRRAGGVPPILQKVFSDAAAAQEAARRLTTGSFRGRNYLFP